MLYDRAQSLNGRLLRALAAETREGWPEANRVSARNSGGVTLTAAMPDRAIDRLLKSRGKVVNGPLDAER